jgi:hypothetical protein
MKLDDKSHRIISYLGTQHTSKQWPVADSASNHEHNRKLGVKLLYARMVDSKRGVDSFMRYVPDTFKSTKAFHLRQSSLVAQDPI